MVHLALAHAPTGFTPDPIRCEVCDKEVPLAHAHALALSYNMPGTDKKAYHCIAHQHFACTHEHAVIAMLCCLFEHLDQGDHEANGKEYGGTDIEAIRAILDHYTVVPGARGV